MQPSICFISGRKISLEARLFTQAVCRHSCWNGNTLITRCSSVAEMIAFDTWQFRGDPIHLLLPGSVKSHPSRSQLEIMRKVEASGGKLVTTDSCAATSDSDLSCMLELSQRIVIMEVERDHPILSIQSRALGRNRTAVFQWAIPIKLNGGCPLLVKMGIGTPLFPGHWKEKMTSFAQGIPLKSDEPIQLDLGLHSSDSGMDFRITGAKAS